MSIGFPKPEPRARMKRQAVALKGRLYRDACRAVNVRDGYKCRVCKRHVVPGGVYLLTRGEHHHVTFRSQGGKHKPGNLILICGECHADIHAHRITVTGNADGRITVQTEKRK